MDKDYVIRNYEPGDEEGLVELLKIVFNGWPHFEIPCSPVDHWVWKYLDNPYGKMVAPVAADGNLIIGSNHGTTQKLRLLGETYLSSQGTDLAVHPDYRRMGVYAKTSEYKTEMYRKEGYSLTWAVTGNPVVFDSNMEWGRRPSPQKVYTYIRVQDVDKHFEYKKTKDALIKKIGAKFLIGSRKIMDSLSGPDIGEKESDYAITEVNSLDKDYDGFWSQVAPSYDLIIERPSSYLNWRYFDPRAGASKVYAAKRGREWLGYIVIRVNRVIPDYPEAYIADILSLPGRSDVASSLIREANEYIDRENINIIYIWAIEGSHLLDLLVHEEYMNSRYVPYFIYQNIGLTSKWDEMYKVKADHMHVQYGDSDWI